MNARITLAITMLPVFALGTAFALWATPAAAGSVTPYLGNVNTGGETGANTLEEVLKIKINQVEIAENIKNPSTGSGTLPVGAKVLDLRYVIAAAVGSIAAAFFTMGRTGKYAAVRSG